MGCTTEQINWNSSVWAGPFGAYSCTPDAVTSTSTATQSQHGETSFSTDQRLRHPGPVAWNVEFTQAKRFGDKPNAFFRQGVLVTESERSTLACNEDQAAVKVKFAAHDYSEALCEPMTNVHLTGTPAHDYDPQVSAR
jgi:hypothetical protein